MYNALLIKRNGLHFGGIELSDRVLNTTVSLHIFKTTRNTYVECAKFIPRPIAIHTRLSIIDRIKRTSICISYMDDKIQSSAKSPTQSIHSFSSFLPPSALHLLCFYLSMVLHLNRNNNDYDDGDDALLTSAQFKQIHW